MPGLVRSTSRFKAFADPTRLRILSLLGERELCVCDLVAVLGEPQPKVSRHLAILRRAGLVRVRVEGPWRHYAIPRPQRGLTTRLLGCVRECMDAAEELQADRARLAQRNLEAPCA